MKKYFLLLLAISLIIVSIAYADCWYNGNLYPTGTVINCKTCQPDGSWK